MKHKPKMLSKSSRYRRFTNSKDQALEKLLIKARAKAADELRHAMRIVKDEVTRTYPHLSQGDIDPRTVMELRALDTRLDSHFMSIATNISQDWIRFRKQSYQLTYAAEQVAISNAGIKKQSKPLHDSKVLTKAYDDTSLGNVGARTYLALSKIRRQVLTNIDLARIMEDTLHQAIDRALSAFPKPQKLKKPVVLKRLTEAADDDVDEEELLKKLIDSGALPPTASIGDDDWQEIVAEYKSEFIPKYRDPRYELESPVSVGEDEGYIVYPYELENEMTEDFVQKVRDGENDAANSKGITDFVWVAVVDKATDECCLWRDGLTTAEIESKLDGEMADDECDAVAPPAHFNCRCRLVPATDDLPDVPDTGEVEFEDWLNS